MAKLSVVTLFEVFGLQANSTENVKNKNSKLYEKFIEIDKLPVHHKTVLIKMIDGLFAQNRK